MPLVIRLEDEDGNCLEEVHDKEGDLNTLLPLLTERSYSCFRFIDPYGNTVFNRLQMSDFLSEASQLAKGPSNPRARALLIEIGHLGEECQKEPHLYIKFYGD